MQVNGYILKETIKRFVLDLTTQKRLLPDTFKQFEVAISPITVAEEVIRLSIAIAELEHFRQLYNTSQNVTFEGKSISLSVALKTQDVFSQLESSFRNSVAGKKDRYSLREEERDPEKEYKIKAITDEKALEMARNYAKLNAMMRQEIAKANAQMMDLPEKYEKYFIE